MEQQILAEASTSEDDSSDGSLLSLDMSSSSDSCEEEYTHHPKVSQFSAVIREFNDEDFKSNFRLNRSTVQILIDRYAATSFYQDGVARGRSKVGPEKEIHIFLWYVGNTNTFREIGNLFGVCKSTAWIIVVRVSEWLISIGHEYVKWPHGIEVVQSVALYERTKRIPGVIGSIDGTHIRIKAPTSHKESFFNRKRYYSVCLQAVVDAKKRFIDVFCGEAGSLHDGRVLRRSPLYQTAVSNKEELFPDNCFLLGDSAYPCLDWLVVPFKDNGQLSTSQHSFNVLHSSARVLVENVFGLWKSRFRRVLHFTEQKNLAFVVNLISCTCILHNLCIGHNDDFPEINQAPDEDDLNANQTTPALQTNRRQQLLEELIRLRLINNN